MRIFVRNKKGSLSLSMEAIVILIIAVVMLGLGLSFVRGMFSNITERANKAIDIADLTAKPTEGEPITFSPNQPSVKEGQQVEVQVGFYNREPSCNDWVVQVFDAQSPNPCGGPPGATGNPLCYNTIQLNYNNKPFTLDKDKSTGWYLIFKPRKGTITQLTPGESSISALFTIKICCTGSPGSNTCQTGAPSYQKELNLFIRS